MRWIAWLWQGAPYFLLSTALGFAIGVWATSLPRRAGIDDGIIADPFYRLIGTGVGALIGLYLAQLRPPLARVAVAAASSLVFSILVPVVLLRVGPYPVAGAIAPDAFGHVFDSPFGKAIDARAGFVNYQEILVAFGSTGIYLLIACPGIFRGIGQTFMKLRL